MSHFPHLFSPLQLRTVHLRNRIMVPPHGNGLATHEFLPSERQAYYFAEKARGGVGVIIWGGSTVHPNSVGKAGRNLVSDERAIPGYRFATDLVHAHGAHIFAQLSHQGRQQTSKVSRLPTWGPSPLPDPLNRVVPKEMEPEDFDELIQYYKKGAAVALAGGFDGVEVYAAHGYLLSQFLSPMSNQRQDEYGGSLENRLRFPLRVLQAVRSALGTAVPMGIRINGDDLVDGGLTNDDMVELAPLLVEQGDVDYISVSGGTYHNMPYWIAEMTKPPGLFVPFAAAIRTAVSVPVAAVNRIGDPVQAEDILARGFADLVAVNRAIIADPFWAEKARSGRADEIRRCTFSNQGCMARSTAGLPISCIHNPTIAYERQWGEGTLAPAETPRRVVVVGGGPAGMEAARVAARRGHRVILLERSGALGGQVNLITRLPSRSGFAEIVGSCGAELARLGVEVRLHHTATPESLRDLDADVLVFATGSAPRRDGYSPALPGRAAVPGADLPWVLAPHDAFAEGADTGPHVLIHDELSDPTALVTAEYLLNQGRTVTLTTRLAQVGLGQEFDSTTLGPQLERLFRNPHGRFGLRPYHLLLEVRADHSALFRHVYSKADLVITGVDTVIIAAGSLPQNEFYRAARAQRLAPTVLAVGDCVAPRNITDSVYDAHRVMREV